MQYIHKTPSINFYAATDASSIAGGVSIGDEWISYNFRGDHKEWHINVKEAHALIMLLFNWRHKLQGRKVFVYIDNQPLDYAMRRKWSPSQRMMPMIYEIALLMMEYRIAVWSEYVVSEHNKLADMLSRNDLNGFRRCLLRFGVTAQLHPIKFEYYTRIRMQFKPVDEDAEFAHFEKWFTSGKI